MTAEPLQSLARISVVGVSGAGKSTVARAAAGHLRVPYIELDAIYHGPNWTPIPDSALRRIVAELVRGDAWVIDGSYRQVRDLVWSRATTVVWVDLPKPVVMAQVIWRSGQRAVTREKLWQGNREDIRSWVDPEHPIRWALSTYGQRRAEYEALMAAHWVRLRSRAEVRRWLDGLR
ncbi:MAG TPA: adenylate kinase [bacterium]|nr:adenylate kinase [bacterium]